MQIPNIQNFQINSKSYKDLDVSARFKIVIPRVTLTKSELNRRVFLGTERHALCQFGDIHSFETLHAVMSAGVSEVMIKDHRNTIRDISTFISRVTRQRSKAGELAFSYCPLVHSWFPYLLRVLSVMFKTVELQFDMTREESFIIKYSDPTPDTAGSAVEYFSKIIAPVFISGAKEVYTSVDEAVIMPKLLRFAAKLQQVVYSVFDQISSPGWVLCSEPNPEVFYEEQQQLRLIERQSMRMRILRNRANRLMLCSEKKEITDEIMFDFSAYDRSVSEIARRHIQDYLDSLQEFPLGTESNFNVDCRKVLDDFIIVLDNTQSSVEIQDVCGRQIVLSDSLVHCEKVYGTFPLNLNDS